MKGLERQEPHSKMLGILLTVPRREARVEPGRLCLSFPIALAHPRYSEEDLRGAGRPLFSFPPPYGSGDVFPLVPNPFPPTTAPPKQPPAGTRGFGSLPVPPCLAREMPPRHRGHCDPPISQRAGVWHGHAHPGGRAMAGGWWDVAGERSQVLGCIPAVGTQMPLGRGTAGTCPGVRAQL